MTSPTPAQIASLGFDIAHLSSRPLAEAPDGYYDYQISTDPADQREGHSVATNFISRVEAVKKAGFIKPDPKLIATFADSVAHPEAVDDRKGALVTGLNLISRMDPYSATTKKLQDQTVGTLYNTVPHPPASYLGPTKYRQADGGGNCLQNPDLGRAGQPYARSVQGKAGLPLHSLPDPGLVYDTILKRNKVVNHPGGMSSMIFAFATIVTHSLFRTDSNDMNINLASSYLDLSPVYGDNQQAQDQVRDKEKGLGLLYPDTFAEDRLLLAPPATAALLVLFSRNHNFIAQKLLKINEWKKWSDPPPSDPAACAAQDEELFQTARLINCGHFMSCIMGDYVAGFLGASEGVNLSLEPFDVIDKKDLQVPRGEGNHVSVEFSILYRWHATLSQEDTKWTEDIFTRAFGGKPFNQLSIDDMRMVAVQMASASTSSPSQRVFGGLSRGADGKFSDDGLASILQRATESPAGAFRGQGTPEVMRIVEITGIMQARRWGLCTMNEFRKFLGLKEFDSFEEWNPDPVIANAARRLYGHIENLELYTGLQAEATIPLAEGFRFACGYTTTRGVLGDAFALVRGDRFNTSNFTPANLTTWGFKDCQRDLNNGGFGGQIPKLLIRHLPRHYPYNSVYSTFPFFTPSKMKTSLTRLGIADKYTFDRPVVQPIPKVLTTFTGIREVFNDPGRFKTMYVKLGYGFFVMFDDLAAHDTDKAMMMHALFPDKDSLSRHVAWYIGATEKQIKEKSWKYPGVAGTYIDISQAITAVTTHLSAEKFCGITLKTKEDPKGVCTEQEYADMLKILFTVSFLTNDLAEDSFNIHTTAERAGALMSALTSKALFEVSPSSAPNFVQSIIARTASYIWPVKDKPYYQFLSTIAGSGISYDAMLGNILGTGVGAAANHAQAAIHVVYFYMEDEREKERREIVELAHRNDSASTQLLQGYVREAMRLRPQVAGLWRRAVVDAEIQQGSGLPPLKVKAGEPIWNDFRTAHQNPAEFPNPQSVDPTRPESSYNLNSMGFHRCVGTTYTQQATAEMLRVIFKLKNLRRAPGDAGRLVGFVETIRGTETQFYLTRDGRISTFPGSLHLVYDE